MTLFAISSSCHPAETAGWHERETRGVTAAGLDVTVLGTVYTSLEACDTQASKDNAASIAAARLSSTPMDVLRLYDCVFDPGKMRTTHNSFIAGSRAFAGHLPPAASAIASSGFRPSKPPLPDLSPVPAPCMKSGADLATLAEFTPSPAQLVVYRNSYRSEVVHGIRSASTSMLKVPPTKRRGIVLNLTALNLEEIVSSYFLQTGVSSAVGSFVCSFVTAWTRYIRYGSTGLGGQNRSCGTSQRCRALQIRYER